MDGLWLTNRAGFLSEMGSRGGKIHQPENEGGQLYSTNQKMRGGQLLMSLMCTNRYIHKISPPAVFPRLNGGGGTKVYTMY